MTDILETLKDKYSEDIGWTFGFFDIVVFVVYLVTVRVIVSEEFSSIAMSLLEKTISEIFIDEDSLIFESRLIDYLAAFILTIISIYGYRQFRCWAYEFLSKHASLETYISKLKQQYEHTFPESETTKLILASEIRDQKAAYLKRFATMNGFSLIVIALSVSGFLGIFYTQPLTDIAISAAGVVAFLILQWLIFKYYTIEIVPRMVFEKTLRGETVRFGDDAE